MAFSAGALASSRSTASSGASPLDEIDDQADRLARGVRRDAGRAGDARDQIVHVSLPVGGEAPSLMSPLRRPKSSGGATAKNRAPVLRSLAAAMGRQIASATASVAGLIKYIF